MSINRELSQLASFLDVQESNNFIGISTGGTYTVGIGTSSVTISSNGTITATQFDGPTGNSLIDHIDLQDEGSLVGTGFTTLNFVGAAVTITQGVTGVATITVDSAVVGGEDGAVQFASGGTLTGISTLLFADSTNHRIGIGSSSPTAKLDVGGTVNVSGISTFQSHVHLGDDDELRFGASNDFKIVHDPNDCRFENSNGDIKFKNTGSYFFFDEDGGETLASFINDGSVNLYHGGDKKLETTGIGVSIVGTGNTATITGPSELVLDPAAVGDNTGKVVIFGDLQVDGTTTEINSTTLTVDDKSIVLASGAADSSAANGAGIEVDGASATFQYAHSGTKWVANKDLQAEAFIKNGGTSSQFLKADGSVDSGTYLTSADGGDAATLDTLDSTQFLRSDAADIKTSGDLRFDDSVKASFGTDDDLKIYSNNVHSYISNYAGQLMIDQEVDSGYINIRNDNGSGSLTDYIVAHGGSGEVRLYHFGTQKLATKSNGIDVTGHTETDTLNVSGIATAQDFNSASDENLKTNIRTIEDPLAKVVQIRGVNFDWKETQRPALGVIAQEIEKVLPELVTDNGTKTVNYNGLIGLLIEAVKAQQEEIDILKSKIK